MGEAERLVAAVPYWWHSIRVADGLVTPGAKPVPLETELAALQLPDLDGLAVLDIGAWDGGFSFAAEQAGAARVVALDHYVWSLDLAANAAYRDRCEAVGIMPEPPEALFWDPAGLPGKQGFDVARRLLGSRVEDLVGDFMAVDVDGLGVFDVVLYLGVLYHMTDPVEALRRLRRVTGRVAVIESQAVVYPGLDAERLVLFFPGAELNADPSNWWVPTIAALEGLCLAAGFSRVEVMVGPPPHEGPGGLHYRAVVHAHV